MLRRFLSPEIRSRAFDLEDSLPSTLSRKTALNLKHSLKAEASVTKCIAAAYYQSWATSPTPSNIDYSKFDVIFFGGRYGRVRQDTQLI